MYCYSQKLYLDCSILSVLCTHGTPSGAKALVASLTEMSLESWSSFSSDPAVLGTFIVCVE